MPQHNEPDSAAQITPRTVRCPRCGGSSVYSTSNRYRPFCSATCQSIDFGAWASEAYRVSPPSPDLIDPDDAKPPAAH